MKVFCLKRRGSKKKKKSFYLLSFSPILGRNVKLLKWPLKKKKQLKPNLSKTLQVLGMVAIVSGNECYSASASSSFHASCSPIDIKVHNTHLGSQERFLLIGPVNVRACCH